jgi:hypothetical protein
VRVLAKRPVHLQHPLSQRPLKTCVWALPPAGPLLTCNDALLGAGRNQILCSSGTFHPNEPPYIPSYPFTLVVDSVHDLVCDLVYSRFASLSHVRLQMMMRSPSQLDCK